MALRLPIAVLWVALLWSVPGHATPNSFENRALALVELLIERVANDAVGEAWVEQYFERADPETQGMRRAHAARDQSLQHLARGSSIGEALRARPGVLGAIRGPDYVRVVLEGPPWLTVVVVRGPRSLQVRTVEQSQCGLCSEPERFVTDLVAEAQSVEGGRRRMLPGVDLDAPSDLTPEEKTAWVVAWQARHATAGYTRWLLLDAEVVGASGRQVEIRWGDRAETWPVVYREGRWWIDYPALPQDSLLALGPDEVDEWNGASRVREATVAWWRPSWRPMAQGVLVAEDLLYLEPRMVQGDVVAYGHDLGRRYAMVLLLDAETGAIHSAVEAPRLPERIPMPLEDWRDLFRFSLSPTGKLLAVAAHDRLWVLKVDTGEVVHALRNLVGAGALAWSPEGDWLAVADRRIGLVRLLDARRGFREAAREVIPRALIQDLRWMEGRLLLVTVEGEMSWRAPPDLGLIASPAVTACCGLIESVFRFPGTGELWINCGGGCVDGRLWTWNLLGESSPAPADVRYPAGAGAIALDTSGRWLVTPYAADPAGRAALWATGEESPRVLFGPDTLRHVAWDASGSAIWAVDVRGRTWKWKLADLLEPASTRSPGDSSP